MSIKNNQLSPESSDVTVEPEHTPARTNVADETSVVSSSRTDEARHGDSKQERGGRNENFFERTAQFVRDTRAEMRRVSWPSATEVKNTTIITIIAVIFFAIYLYVVDQSFTFLIAQISRLLGWLASFVI